MIRVVYNAGFYVSDIESEAWLTKRDTGVSRVVKLVHPGCQYEKQMREYFKSRGFDMQFR